MVNCLEIALSLACFVGESLPLSVGRILDGTSSAAALRVSPCWRTPTPLAAWGLSRLVRHKNLTTLNPSTAEESAAGLRKAQGMGRLTRAAAPSTVTLLDGGWG